MCAAAGQLYIQLFRQGQLSAKPEHELAFYRFGYDTVPHVLIEMPMYTDAMVGNHLMYSFWVALMHLFNLFVWQQPAGGERLHFFP